MRVCAAVNITPVSRRATAAHGKLDQQDNNCGDQDADQQGEGEGFPGRAANQPEQTQPEQPEPGIAGMSQQDCQAAAEPGTLGYAQPSGQAVIQFQ